jgi:hypothetical protein
MVIKMKTVVLCYGLLIHQPIDTLASWLHSHGVRAVIQQQVPGALYVGHSIGAGTCAAMAAANHGTFIALDPVPPMAGSTVISAAALGRDHLSVVNDPRSRAMILRMAR